MTFRIPGSILALSVWLIDRFAVDARTGGGRAPEVLINVVDKHYQARTFRSTPKRRTDFMLGCNAVQPDRRHSSPNFGVKCLALLVTVDSCGFKPECFHQKVMRSGKIFVDKKRDNAVDTSHGNLH